MIKISAPLAALCALFVFASPATAGTPVAAPSPTPEPRHSFLDPIGDFARDTILKPVAPFELVPGKDPNGWGFVIEPYVWAMGLNGNMGVGGLPAAHVGFSSSTILQHLDWGIFARGEVRKGRWGVLADGYYAALSASASPTNRLYDSINLGLQQSLVSLAIAYRVIDDRRGFLDVYAGARYNFIGAQVDSSLNNSRINQVSDNVTTSLANNIDTRLDSAFEKAVAAAVAKVDAEVVEVQARAQQAQEAVETLVSERIRKRDIERLLLGNVDLRQLARRDLLKRDLVGGSVNGALQDYIRASARAKVATARGTVDSAAEAAAAQAKKKLSKAIAETLEDSIPTDAAGNEWWVDPIIGLRGQINFTRWLFLAAQGDVGGFGAGSQIAWNVQTTLGVNFTRNVFAEIGYRYMYVDYTDGGFLYQMNSYGLYSGVGVRF